MDSCPLKFTTGQNSGTDPGAKIYNLTVRGQFMARIDYNYEYPKIFKEIEVLKEYPLKETGDKKMRVAKLTDINGRTVFDIRLIQRGKKTQKGCMISEVNMKLLVLFMYEYFTNEKL